MLFGALYHAFAQEAAAVSRSANGPSTLVYSVECTVTLVHCTRPIRAYLSVAHWAGAPCT